MVDTCILITVFALIWSCSPVHQNRRSGPTPDQGKDATVQDDVFAKFPATFFKPTKMSTNPAICTDDLEDEKPSLPERRLSDSYLNNCSGCHGTSGEGNKEFPSLRSVSSAEKFVQIVRAGGVRMPGFSEDLVSKEDLSGDFALLSSKDALPSLDTQSVPVRGDAQFDEASYVSAMQKGLIAWRTPGERGACVACHGPDGIDLARLDYPNSAILRRALGQGLPSLKSMAIVTMVSAQRWRYGVKTPCRSRSFVPLQPGGKVLAGNSSSEKDRALYEALRLKGIDLKVEADTEASATEFFKALAALDVRQIPIAVKLNRWTEDSFHGDSHRSTAEWLPEIPLEPKTSESETEWIKLQNSYLQDPSDENFWRLLDGVELLSSARFTNGGVSQRVAKEKYKAVLQLQHMLRFGDAALPDLSKTKNLDRFSVWETAQIASVMGRGCADTGSSADPYPCWNYPASFYKKMGADRAWLLDDVLKITFPWLVAGWVLDPALQLTEGGDAQMIHLLEAGQMFLDRFGPDNRNSYNQLPLHGLYFSMVRLAKSVEAPDERFPIGPHLDQKPARSCWNQVGQGLGQWIEATLPHLSRILDANRTQAVGAEQKDLVFTAIGKINKAVLLKIKSQLANPAAQCKLQDHPVLSLKEAVTKIGQWHEANNKDASIGVLVSEIAAIMQ